MRILVAVMSLGFLSSCLEMEKEQMAVPPQASCENVESSLNQGVAGSERRLQEEDWVHFEESIAVTSQQETILLDQVRKIIKLIPVGSGSNQYFEARLFETNVTYKNGQPQSETKETMEDVPTVYTLCPAPTSVKFFGLSASGGLVDVKQYRENCGTYENCQMKVSRVNFDQLVTLADGSSDSVKYRLVLSSEVPYFGRFLEMCVTQSYEINGQRIPATRCKRVRNFGFKGE